MTAEECALLQTRKTALLAQIAGVTATAGGGADYSVDGQSVSRIAQRKALYEELTAVNEALVTCGGPIEEITHGF